MSLVVLILAPIVFFAYAIQSAIGFGAMLIIVTLGSHVLAIDLLVPMAVPFSIFISFYISIRYFRFIDKGLLFKQIFPLMVVGICLGFVLYPLIKGDLLKRIFGVIVTVYAARELFFSLRPTTSKLRRLSCFERVLWLILAGITHAIYATGGPMLVYVVGRIGLTKSVFRATLCTVWAVLNTFLTVAFIANGRIDGASLMLTAALLPALGLGIVMGEWLHGRVSEQRFQRMTHAMLLLAGVALVL